MEDDGVFSQESISRVWDTDYESELIHQHHSDHGKLDEHGNIIKEKATPNVILFGAVGTGKSLASEAVAIRNQENIEVRNLSKTTSKIGRR